MYKFKRKRASPPVTMKLSSTFVMKSICKHCSSPPVSYYYLDSKTSYKDPKSFKEEDQFFNNFLPINSRIRPQVTTRSLANSLNYYQYTTTDKCLSVKYHKMIKSSKSGLHNDLVSNILEFLVCKCEKTEWAYSSLSVEDRPDIKNRQAGKKYPFKFKY